LNVGLLFLLRLKMLSMLQVLLNDKNTNKQKKTEYGNI